MKPDNRMPKAIARTWPCESVIERLFARLSETRIMFTRFLPPSQQDPIKMGAPTNGNRTHFQPARQQRRGAAARAAAAVGQAPAEALPDPGTREPRFREPGVRHRRYDRRYLRGVGARSGGPPASCAPPAPGTARKLAREPKTFKGSGAYFNPDRSSSRCAGAPAAGSVARRSAGREARGGGGEARRLAPQVGARADLAGGFEKEGQATPRPCEAGPLPAQLRSPLHEEHALEEIQ